MDLDLKIRGDSSEAVGAFNDVKDASEDLAKETEKQAKASKYAWEQLAKGAAVAGAAVVAFGAASVKAYADAERIQKQLERAAGSYSGALDKQAQALMRLYAVDDDIIKQSQTLLVQWGGVGAATKGVEVAALNLAAAMGTDLKTATEDLIRNVESGGTGLAKMGVHFKSTGDKGKDLAAIVEAINGKFGGAAAADANSLTGQVHAASLAFQDLQKSIGGSISKFIQGTGAIEVIAKKMRELNGLMTPSADKKEEDQGFVAEQVNYWDQIASGNMEGWKDAEKGIKFTFEEAQAELAKWRAKLRPTDFNLVGGTGTPGVTGKTNKGGKEDEQAAKAHADAMAAIHEKNAEEWKKYLGGIDDLEEHARIKEQSDYAEELQMSAKRVDLAIKEGDDKTAALQLSIARDNELYEKQVKYRDAAAARILKETNESNATATAKQEAQWAQVGGQIGASFVNALSTQLEKLSEGGEFDVAIFVGDILASAFAIAATAIGAAYGQGALGSAIGNLGAMGIRAGASGISASERKARGARNGRKTYHSGGWVEDDIDVPRHHSGAWIGHDERPAILLTEERVASRQEVKNAGGRDSLDHILKGGRGPTNIFMVSALDAKSAAESFESEVGKGLKRAANAGRGDVPRLLGAGNMGPR